MQQLMQQAKVMQKQLQNIQENMKNTDFIGESGNGVVKITINGAYQMKKVEIDNSMIDINNKDMLEDLIVVAYNNAKKKVEDETKNSAGSMGVDSNLLNNLF